MSAARLIRLLALAGAALACPLPGDALGFTAALTPIKARVRPGQRLERAFHLQLVETDGPARFRAHVEDWWTGEKGQGSVYAAPGTLARSCGTWTSVGPVESEVERGGQLQVRISVAVPEEATPGGYWCALTVDQLPDPAEAGAGVQVRFLASVSTAIFLEIEPVHRQARIAGVELTPEAVAVRVLNAGDVALGVEGRVEFLAPGRSEPVASALIPRATVLPEPVPERRLEARLPGPEALPSGTYVVRVILDAGLDHYIALQKTVAVRGALAAAR